jgi:quinol monooxygenase YgiN
MLRQTLPFVLSALLVGAVLCGESRAAEEHPVVALVKSKVKDPNKPFAMIVTFKVKAGKEKEFEAAFVPCLAATHKEPGCISYELNRDPDDPTTYFMYEKFKSVAALDAHIKMGHTQTLLKTVGTLTEGDPKVKVYTVPE